MFKLALLSILALQFTNYYVKFNFGKSHLPSDSNTVLVIFDCFAYPSRWCQITVLRSVNSDHMKRVLNTFKLNGHILIIICDSTKLHDMKNKSFILTVFFSCFSVGQMAVSPSSHYYSLHVLMLALQVTSRMKHFQIVCDHVSSLENTKKHLCTEGGSRHQIQLPFCLVC